MKGKALSQKHHRKNNSKTSLPFQTKPLFFIFIKISRLNIKTMWTTKYINLKFCCIVINHFMRATENLTCRELCPPAVMVICLHCIWILSGYKLPHNIAFNFKCLKFLFGVYLLLALKIIKYMQFPFQYAVFF